MKTCLQPLRMWVMNFKEISSLCVEGRQSSELNSKKWLGWAGLGVQASLLKGLNTYGDFFVGHSLHYIYIYKWCFSFECGNYCQVILVVEIFLPDTFGSGEVFTERMLCSAQATFASYYRLS